MEFPNTKLEIPSVWNLRCELLRSRLSSPSYPPTRHHPSSLAWLHPHTPSPPHPLPSFTPLFSSSFFAHSSSSLLRLDWGAPSLPKTRWWWLSNCLSKGILGSS
ncbi:hypothetical protein E2C01_065919 [Portunus trituberculatus]|uniref:Uncharacterized protein n=1 Tax=Portunus trituberculatus TaxID=210409 RepID=A0A5B7HPQ5_PORTR|nr:hypothetical protein [Portunus trituberculatus]